MSDASRFREIVAVFLRLGLIGFGGPAAHVALFRREFVESRKWLTAEEFDGLFALAALLPGPTSTELALAIGKKRGGTVGLVAAALGFIGPAVTLSILLALGAMRFVQEPWARGALTGVGAVATGLILRAAYDLLRRAFEAKALLYAPLGAVPLFAGFPVAIPYVVVGWAVAMTTRSMRVMAPLLALTTLAGLLTALPLPGLSGEPTLARLALVFMFIGAASVGGGDALFGFTQDIFVRRLGWLTSEDVLRALAIGQTTPGPVYSSAGALGVALGGIAGGVLACLAIFTPAVLGIAVGDRLLRRIQADPNVTPVFAAINAVSAGTILAAGFLLARSLPLALLPLIALGFIPPARLNTMVSLGLGAGVGAILRG